MDICINRYGNHGSRKVAMAGQVERPRPLMIATWIYLLKMRKRTWDMTYYLASIGLGCVRVMLTWRGHRVSPATLPDATSP